MENQQTKQIIQEKTELKEFRQMTIPNHKEIEFAIKTNTINFLEKPLIAKIYRYDTRNINTLNEDSIQSLRNETDGFVDQFPDSDIIPLFQLNKGMDKTEYIEVIIQSQLTSKCQNVSLQEINREQDLLSFNEQIRDFKKISKEKTIYLHLEIESDGIKNKILSALDKGIKNFIIRAGMYHDLKLWRFVIKSIQAEDGKIFVSLLRRYDGTKKSYIEHFLKLGADYVFHEAFPPFGGNKTLHLDEQFNYVEMDIGTALAFYSERNRQHFEEEIQTNKDLVYPFSRVRAISLANSLAPTVELFEIS